MAWCDFIMIHKMSRFILCYGTLTQYL